MRDRPRIRGGHALGWVLLLLGSALPGEAQDLALKRSLPAPERMVCAAAAEMPSRPPAGGIVEAERLGAAAQEAALLGELERARELLDRATRLDPGAAQLAYHHARTLEELGRAEAAFGEYCRYLTMVPTSPETEALARHTAEIAPLRSPLALGILAAFEGGVQAFDQSLYGAADSAFTTVIAGAPTWDTPYYNRALARLLGGDRAGAKADLDAYAARAPEDESVLALRALLSPPASPARRFSPALALSSGVVVPGFGQLYTRRPGLTLLTLAGTGGALYLAFQQRNTSETSSSRHPYRAAGIGAAAALTLMAAVEACVYAARDTAPRTSARVEALVGPLPPTSTASLASPPSASGTPLFAIRISTR